MSPSFQGFSPSALDFLVTLGRNNEKAWFEAHRLEFKVSAFTRPWMLGRL